MTNDTQPFCRHRSQQLLKRSKGQFLLIVSLCSCFLSCEEFVTVDVPNDQLVSATVYKDDVSATSAIIGIYSEMMNTESFASGGSESITLLAGLSADEFISYTNAGEAFHDNDLYPENTLLKSALWEPGYKYIYYANSVLEGLSASSGVNANLKRQLEGEARFIRAFSFFYLTNLFGDVPLITTTDHKVNENFSRTAQELVYEQIIEDLTKAEALLANDYSVSGGKRVRPNKWAATALLARVYLYTGDWGRAEAAATSVIDRGGLYVLEEPDSVFLANSTEAIWQLMPVYPGYNTFEAMTFIATGYPSFISLRPEVVNAFEAANDLRMKWIDSIAVEGTTYYYPFKYKVGFGSSLVTEYSLVLRLAEQYLIRAEAMAQQNDLSAAITDLDSIRQRAGLPRIQDTDPSIQKAELLLAIEHERQRELFAEWGHRWLDLKRTHRTTAVLSAVKTGWQAHDVLYPVPQSEIDNNRNLLPQNQGY